MKLFRLTACILAVFLVLPLVGCKSAVSKVFNVAKKEIKEEVVEEGIKYAAGAVVGDNQGKSSSPSAAGKNSSRSNLAKAGGMAAVGGAAVAQVTQVASESDLTLGDVSIGYNRDDVYSLLGKERKITDPDNTGHLRYQYPEMEVVITRGKVTGFVSNTAKVATPRGIRQGDSLQKVLNAYGEPYAQSNFDDLTLYEYKMRSLDYNECLLRFAVKNGKVDYISARVLE